MSSWFGNGLSQITGQISNFTKEVLEEGTGEVDDHVTQLKITRKHLLELDQHSQAQRAEIERMKVVNDELEEKLQSADLQNTTISNEYRDIIKRKETEIQELKQHQNDLYEQQRDATMDVLPPAGPGMSHSSSAPSLIGFTDAASHDDFDDLITSQHEINRLRNENKRLDHENRHWKQVAKDNSSAASTPDSEQILQLEAKLKELQHRYDDELDHHHKELAALHNVHAQKVATLKRKNNEQLSRLQGAAEPSKDAGRRGSSSDRSSEDLSDKLQHMDKVHQKLTFDFELTHAADREKARQLQQLQGQVELLNADNNKLAEDKVSLSKERDDLLEQLDSVVSERRTMSVQINDLANKLRDQERVVKDLRGQKASAEAGDDTSANSEIEALKEQLSDWQMEKEALEDVLLRLRQELRQSQQSLGALQAQRKENADIQSESESPDGATGAEASSSVQEQEALLFQEQISTLNAELTALRSEVQEKGSALIESRKNLEVASRNVQDKADQLHKLEEILNERPQRDVHGSSPALDTTKQESLQTEVAELHKKIDEKQSSCDQLTVQIRDTQKDMTELARLKDDLQKEAATLRQKFEEANLRLQDSEQNVEELRRKNDMLSNEKAKLVEGIADDEQSMNENLIKEKDLAIENLQAEKANLVESLTAERDGLVESLEELDSQHEIALQQMIEDRGQLVRDNENLKTQVQELSFLSTSGVADPEESEKLQEELDALKTAQEESEAKLGLLQETEAELTEAKSKLAAEIQALEDKLQEASDERDQLRVTCDKLQHKLQDSGSESEKLKSEVAHIKKELSHCKVLNQNQQLLTETLEKATDSGKNAETSDFSKESLERVKLEHASEISRMNEAIDSLKRDATEMETAQSRAAEHMRQQLLDVTNKLEKLQQEYSERLKELEERDVRIADQASLLEELGTLQENHKSLLESCRNKDRQIENFQQNVDLQQEARETERTTDPSLSTNTADTMLELENPAGIDQTLTEKLQQEISIKDAEVTKFREEVAVLRGTIAQYKEQLDVAVQEQQTLTSQVGELQDSLAAKDAALSELKQYHTDCDNLEKNDTSSNRERLKGNGVPGDSNVIQNGDIKDENIYSTVDELDKVQKLIAQKDGVITQLNDNNSSLLKLLEDRSQAAYGDNTLVDLHQLSNQVKGLRMEKDQMISVLNDKTRECSSLKAEVHRLMNVVSAEKSALCKLQQDNEELLRASAAPAPRMDLGDDDMTKEAIKKLSQMVRDKDLETQALNQKNQTLLQVLQETSTEGAQISALLQEKENLAKQVAMFQNDRDNIVAALNMKHQESVAYHSEIQRLTAVVSADAQKHEKLERDFSGLQQQYEYKQQALVKLQNELLNSKRKFTEADSSLKELQKRKVLDSVNENDLASSTGASGEVDGDAQELQQLRKSLQETQLELNDKDRQLEQRHGIVREKERTILSNESTISERDKTLAELHTKLHRTNESLHSRDSELNSLKKQSENTTFQLHGLQTEIADLRVERDQLYDRTSVLQQELGAIKEQNNRLTIQLNDKEFEITTSKEKTNTLSKLIQDKADGEKGQADREVDRLISEAEVVQAQAQALKHERDQGLLAIQQQQNENHQLRNQIERLQQKQSKLVKELDRLRSHLLAIEDNYTQEAVAAEEREKQLRNRLAAAEEKALSSSSAVQIANQQALQQIDGLQTELHALTEQRDSVLIQLSGAQETANQYATSLHNLQMVLEQFQLERETQQNAEIERYQKDNNGFRHENHQLREQIRELQAQANETCDALEAAQRLSEQLDRKEQTIAALREEVQLRESELRKSEEDVRLLSVSKEAKVDKELVKNLILGYFHTPANKRKEALQLIGRMLEFTASDMEQLGADSTSRGWLRGIFSKSSPTPPSTPGKGSFNQSFSELFVTFLERESSPQPNLRLPADRMVSESLSRQNLAAASPAHRSPVSRAPAFNPFAAPVATSGPPVMGDLNSIPVSAAHPLKHATVLPGSNLLMAPPMGSDPFYQNVPTNSGAILRDVLQQ